MKHKKAVLDLLRKLETKTEGFTLNGSVKMLVKGVPYVIAVTEQHRLSTSPYHLYTHRELASYYGWSSRTTKKRLEEGYLPKHLYTAYGEEVRIDIEEPIALEYKYLCNRVLKDFSQLH